MAKKSLLVKSVIGPGVANKNTTVDVQPAYRFVDGTTINWPIAKTFKLENGQVTIDNVETTYDGDWLVWEFAFRDFDSVNRQIGDTRVELRTFEGATGTPVDYSTMKETQPVQPPEYGPTYADQALEAAQDALASAQEALEAAQRAEAAAVAAAAVGTSSDAQTANNVGTGALTKAALGSAVGTPNRGGYMATEYAEMLVARAYGKSGKSFYADWIASSSDTGLAAPGTIYDLKSTEGSAWTLTRGGREDISSSGAIVASGTGAFVRSTGSVSDYESILGGPEFAVYARPNNASMRVQLWLDNQLAQEMFLTNEEATSTPAPGWLRFKLDRDEVRRVRLTAVNGTLGKLAVSAGAVAMAPPKRPIFAVGVGDSWWADGKFAPIPFNWPTITAEALNWGLSFSGQGGTGVLNTGPAGSRNYQDPVRLTPLINAVNASGATKFIFELSINDIPFPAGDLQTGIGVILDRLTAECPTLDTIYMISPQIRYSIGDPNEARMVQMEQEAQAAAAGRSIVTQFSPRTQQWFYGKYQGKRNNRVLDGSVDWFMWDDGAHPTYLGALHYAIMLITEIILSLSVTQTAAAKKGIPFETYSMRKSPTTPPPDPDPTIYGLDDFHRSDGSGWGSTPTGGFPWASTGSGSTAAIESNKGKLTGTSGVVYWTYNDAHLNGITRVVVADPGSAGFTGLCERMVDGSNLYSLTRVSGSDLHYRLVKRCAAASTTVATLVTTTVTIAAGDVLECYRNGLALDFRINGVSIWTGYDTVDGLAGGTPTVMAASTKHGVAHSAGVGYYESVRTLPLA
ncbi:hypothetical protein [Herbiconiux solani]|uniref:hypothetical protein n=1 Tax=Herbiconiux solani TaxID=661329 RepID=UPI0008268DEC|nr:hypothetical protein [Herbiconiux solani]